MNIWLMVVLALAGLIGAFTCVTVSVKEGDREMDKPTSVYGKSELEIPKFSVMDIEYLKTILKSYEIENRQKKEIIQDLLEAARYVVSAADLLERVEHVGKARFIIGEPALNKLKEAISKAQEER